MQPILPMIFGPPIEGHWLPKTGLRISKARLQREAKSVSMVEDLALEPDRRIPDELVAEAALCVVQHRLYSEP